MIDLDRNTQSQTATIAGDGSTVVEYYYQRKSYDLICHPNNLEPDISDTIRYGSLVVTSPVYWEDHTFRGWYDNPELSGEPCVAGTMPAHDLELWAAWTLNAVIAPEISTELSTGIDATVSAPAWVHGAVWGQLYDPYAHYVGMSFANPPAQGVKTASGHGVIVPSARGLRFSVNGQGWSWQGSFGNYDVLLQNEGGDSKPFTDNLASPIYDSLTIDFGTHPFSPAACSSSPFGAAATLPRSRHSTLGAARSDPSRFRATRRTGSAQATIRSICPPGTAGTEAALTPPPSWA